MKKYEINGKEKFDTSHCSTCNNGHKLDTENKVRTQREESNTDDTICGVCNTKYKTKMNDANKLVDKNCKDCQYISVDKSKCENTDTNYLCVGNQEKFVSKLMEADNVELEYLTAKESYRQTGICFDHLWIESQPFKTAEGTFTIKNCRICGLARTTVNGTTYQDNITKLISWLATRGIDAVKKEKEKSIQLNFLETKMPATQINTANLFTPIETKVIPIANINIAEENLMKLMGK